MTNFYELPWDTWSELDIIYRETHWQATKQRYELQVGHAFLIYKYLGKYQHITFEIPS